MRRTLLGIAAATLALAACGSSGGGDASPTTAAGAATTEAAAATTAAATATTAAATAATTAAATATTAASTAATTAASGGGTASASTAVVTLDEYTVATGALKAGAVSFSVKNDGEFPHELIIVKADSFESLAKSSGGGVDESKATIVAKTERIEGGKTESLTATLEAGKYVFVCNLGSGGNNHAVKGQHLDVTVG